MIIRHLQKTYTFTETNVEYNTNAKIGFLNCLRIDHDQYIIQVQGTGTHRQQYQHKCKLFYITTNRTVVLIKQIMGIMHIG